MSEKQKNKEIRSIQKDLRSRDEAVKSSALKKISEDLDYFQESVIVTAVFEGISKKAFFIRISLYLVLNFVLGWVPINGGDFTVSY
jgi:CTP-dependent riboflavin kinase